MKKVITYGTFDLFHVGHQRILERAKALGDYLIVAVTSEHYDLERGKLSVRDSLFTRIENVRATGLADEIIIEEYLGQKVNDILKYGVDIFVIGSDWIGKFDYLKQYCEVVYLERTKNISSTLLREEGEICRIGIITDRADDADMVTESRFVSGLETAGVFAPKPAVAVDFAERYELGMVYAAPEGLIEDVDIVFVHTRLSERCHYAKQALCSGRHVIFDFPAGSAQIAELNEYAAKRRLALYARMPLAYLRAFHQLIWLVHEGAVGRILRIEIPLSDCRDADELAVALFAAGRIWNGDPRAAKPMFLGCDGTEMIITGENGQIVVPDKWQSPSYFRVEANDKEPKHYSFNIEGSGLRYLLSVMLSVIRSGRRESGMFTREESLFIAKMLESEYL